MNEHVEPSLKRQPTGSAIYQSRASFCVSDTSRGQVLGGAARRYTGLADIAEHICDLLAEAAGFSQSFEE